MIKGNGKDKVLKRGAVFVRNGRLQITCLYALEGVDRPSATCLTVEATEGVDVALVHMPTTKQIQKQRGCMP